MVGYFYNITNINIEFLIKNIIFNNLLSYNIICSKKVAMHV